MPIDIWERRISTGKWHPLFNNTSSHIHNFLIFLTQTKKILAMVIGPFAASIKESKLSMNEKESLIDLSCDDSLKAKSQSSLSGSHFWLSITINIDHRMRKHLNFLFNFQQRIYAKRHFHL